MNIQTIDRAELPTLDRVVIKGPTTDLAGLAIEYREAGPAGAVPIVCLHGIGSNSSGYRGPLNILSDTYRVIAWNAPGYGGSGNLPWPEPTPESYADALAGLVDALKLERIVVVGSSFGAVIAAAFGARYADRVRGVVLSAPAAGFVHAPAEERKAVLDKRIGDMMRLGPAGVAAQRASALVAPGSSKTVLDAAAELVASVHPAGYFQAAHAIDVADTAAAAERIIAPVLVTVGDKDIVTPAASNAEPIHARLQRGRLEVFKGIGHLIKLEAPDAFSAVLRDFVAGLPER